MATGVIEESVQGAATQPAFQTHGEVAGALKKIFTENKSIYESEDISRLDNLLAMDIEKSIAKLTPKEREHFLKVLNDHKPGLSGYAEDLPNGIKGLGDAFAHVNIDPEKGLELSVDIFARHHPVGRLFMRHEASHLSRFVSEAESGKEAATNAMKVVNRKNGIYREEVGAFRDQYRFLKSAYKKEDLAKLKETMPGPSQADLELLKQKGVITQVSGPKGDKIVINMGRVDGDEQATSAYKRYIVGNMNAMYVGDVEKALTMTEPQFIRSWIGQNYRQQQKINNIGLAIQNALWWGKWAGGGGAGAAVYWYENKKQ